MKNRTISEKTQFINKFWILELTEMVQPMR